MTNKLCIIDYVGTLFDGTSIVPDAQKFCSSLKLNGYEIVVYSNTSLISKQTISIALGCLQDIMHFRLRD